MKTRVKTVAPEILLEEYRKLLNSEEKIEALPLVVTGSSMTPFLVGGRDRVYLSRVTRPVRRGDILLYRRSTGAYVLHRVYRADGSGYTMVGDAQTDLEPGIAAQQVIAIVTRARRKGKIQEPGRFWWEFFEKVWIRMVPFRRIAVKAYGIFRKNKEKGTDL